MNAFMGFIFMISVTILLFISQMNLQDASPEMGVPAPIVFKSYDLINHYNVGNGTYIVNTNADLPKLESDLGVFGYFAYGFLVIYNWVTGGTVLILSLFTVVPNFLAMLGLPAYVSFGLGMLWDISALLLLILGVIK